MDWIESGRKMKILICCSKSFYDKVEQIKSILEEKGHEVILPNSYDNPGQEYEIMKRDPEEHARWKGEMFRLSERKIMESDAILVLNYEKNGQQNYVGASTLIEMYDAFRHNKSIFMINPIPQNILQDEIKGFNPMIIDGDLKKVVDEVK